MGSKNLDIQYWEDLLESEGLGNIDTKEGFEEKNIRNTSLNDIKYDNMQHIIDAINDDISDTLDIEKLLTKNNINIVIDFDNSSIELYNFKGESIGIICPGVFYIMGAYSVQGHLRKEVNENYRGRSYGQLLFDLYRKHGFEIPDTEHSQKKSSIRFLIKNGYYISGYYDDNLKFHEVYEDSDVLELFYKNMEIDDLDHAYQLQLQY